MNDQQALNLCKTAMISVEQQIAVLEGQRRELQDIKNQLLGKTAKSVHLSDQLDAALRKVIA